MFNINSFLDKFYKNIKSTEIDNIKILEILEKHTKIKFFLNDIEIKNYVLYIKSTPASLNKVFIFKRKILEDISFFIPNQKIIDIK